MHKLRHVLFYTLRKELMITKFLYGTTMEKDLKE